MKEQKITEPSQTVPGQAISLLELQKKYNSGTLPNIAHPVVTEDETFANAFDLDMSVFDAMEMNTAYENTMRDYLKQQEQVQKEKEEQALFERLKAKYAETAE